MKTCISNKRLYLTEDLAVEALIGARSRFDYPAGGGPVAVYPCDECGHFHLTSRGPMNERLAREIAEGKIRLHREASRWEEKFKKR